MRARGRALIPAAGHPPVGVPAVDRGRASPAFGRTPAIVERRSRAGLIDRSSRTFPGPARARLIERSS
jgi:hypothetical protein